VDIKARWELSEDERHTTSLNVQRSEREIERLCEFNEVWASLYIWHDSDPENISELLRINPDEVSRKGDPLTPEGRWDVRSRRTCWILSSEGKIEQDSIEAHLNWILAQVSGSLPNLRGLQDSGARTKIVIHLNSWSRFQHVELNVETLLLLARYRLSLTINVHYQNTEAEY